MKTLRVTTQMKAREQHFTVLLFGFFLLLIFALGEICLFDCFSSSDVKFFRN